MNERPQLSSAVSGNGYPWRMTNPVAQIIHTRDGDLLYDSIMVWCPGCEFLDEDGEPRGGLHMLPISEPGSPKWDFDGNLDAPTLAPSILTRTNRPEEFICHSFLRAGVFEYLGDCTHHLANQQVPIPPLPDWALHSG